MHRLLLLAAANPMADTGRLESAMSAVGGQMVDSLSTPQAGFRVARPWTASDSPRDEAESFQKVVKSGLSNGVALGGFDVVLSVCLPSEAVSSLAHAVPRSSKQLAGLIDPAGSGLVVGRDEVILEGSGAVHLIYCMRRLESVSHETFSQYWKDQHSQIGKVTPGLAGYRQLHADLDLSAALAAGCGVEIHDIDGVALEWFQDMAAFLVAVGSPPSHAQAAKSSEDNFNDLGRATAIVVAGDG